MSEASTLAEERLDQEYNPRLRVLNFAEVFARWKREAARARESSDARLDVPYGEAASERLDFFPALSGSPLLIFLHGGYWRALDKGDFSWVAPAYVQAGIAVAIVNYGLMPATPLPQIVQQIRRACVWLHDHAAALGFDSGRMICSGHSAGGHLTAMMLATDWPAVAARLPRHLLSAAIAISGVFDLAPLARAPFLRADLALDEAAARALSPVHLPLSNDVPLLRAVGELESSEFHRQSRLIGQVWPAACLAEVMSMPGADHMTVCEAFAARDSALFEAARALAI